uniref:Uncharacterized protein n=1 Tax=Timema genevievae TaxID=629358 RepID=A0A7R9JNQ0_TIMGE|nr:unnamed protein product [Timema genevievae]
MWTRTFRGSFIFASETLLRNPAESNIDSSRDVKKWKGTVCRLCVFVLFVPSSSFTWPNRWYNALMPEWDNGPTPGIKGSLESTARKSRAQVTQPYQADEKTTTKKHNEVAWERFPSKLAKKS